MKPPGHGLNAEACRDRRRSNIAITGEGLGLWPTVHIGNRVVPASGVMFASALPGTFPAWAYRPPDPATALGQRLLVLQQRNAEMLLQQFRETPPQAIAIADVFSRTPKSQRLNDIDVVENHLTKHCDPRYSIAGGERTLPLVARVLYLFDTGGLENGLRQPDQSPAGSPLLSYAQHAATSRRSLKVGPYEAHLADNLQACSH